MFEPLERRLFLSSAVDSGISSDVTASLRLGAGKVVPARPTAKPLPTGGTVTLPAPGNWRMIWSDEFNGTGLRPEWRPVQYWDETHTIVGHGEQQVYDATAISFSNGKLNLTARRETKYGMPYVSGLVMTGGHDDNPNHPKFNFRFGYLEVRAKLVAGQGFWPAIWMMPASYNDDNGEIDLMELTGDDPSTMYMTVHRNGGREGQSFRGPNFAQGYHTFAVDWQADRITFYVDGIVRQTVTDPELICPEAMYPIMNLAVGGEWPGPPDASTPFPSTMSIDYIRVYQKTGGQQQQTQLHAAAPPDGQAFGTTVIGSKPDAAVADEDLLSTLAELQTR
jgi:beta-glucanase (GH16 family)